MIIENTLNLKCLNYRKIIISNKEFKKLGFVGVEYENAGDQTEWAFFREASFTVSCG